MAYNYIRNAFGVNPRVGQRITRHGQAGVIVHTDADPMYLLVRFDGAALEVHVHPTWGIDYDPQPAFVRPTQLALEYAHG
nr:hypothetical protein [uncultured Rhodopila sp.]